VLSEQEEGKVTVRLMSKAGRITQPGHIVGIVRNTLGLEAAGIVGRILMLREGDSEGPLLPEVWFATGSIFCHPRAATAL
jgi:hypothetical protein